MKNFYSKKKKSDRNKSYFNVITSLKQFIIFVSSFILSRFDRTLRKMKINTFVKNITRFQHKNISVNKIFFCAEKTEDSNIITDLAKFKLLIYDSAKIRYVLHQIYTHVLSYTIIQSIKKLLMIENILLNVFYMKFVFNSIHGEIEIIHVDLIDQKRINFVKRFNDFNNSLTSLIIMYQMFKQKVNFDFCCCKVIIIILIENVLSEIQI